MLLQQINLVLIAKYNMFNGFTFIFLREFKKYENFSISLDYHFGGLKLSNSTFNLITVCLLIAILNIRISPINVLSSR